MYKPAVKAFLLTISCFLFAACGGGGSGATSQGATVIPDDNIVPNVSPQELNSGGLTSVNNATADAYDQPAANISFTENLLFEAGDGLFNNPHSGFGPQINGSSCVGCHVRNGKGVLPNDINTPISNLIFFSSIAGNTTEGQPLPDPTYGSQIQVFGQGGALSQHQGELSGAGVIGEAFPFIEFEEVAGQFSDGTPYSLRRPVYKLRDLTYGDFADGIVFSPRMAPIMVGMGLLEAIPDSSLLALEDSSDANNDGVSGRVNRVFDVETQTAQIGRFGWKANVPSVLQQTAVAYNEDSGATNSRFQEENCTSQQQACIAAAELEASFPEVNADDVDLALVEFYMRRVAVPQRRGFNAQTQTFNDDVLRGRSLFFQAGCNACHVQQHTTGIAQGSVLGDVTLARQLTQPAADIAALSNQTIFPYTDLLLHDMGGQCDAVVRETANGQSCTDGADCLWVQRCEGLADGRPEFFASASEWRTPPLWGLGLVQRVNPQATFLHDGRARTIEEAILWHGDENSEARSAWQTYVDFSSSDRNDLIKFLESL